MRAARRRTATSSRTSRSRRYTQAAFLQDPKKKTPVFARFSTVAGGAGSVDTPRDVRGFAVKFYTEEGNFDLVGNNIPVFFIQDAMKFPDLVHSVKMEPDRGFPQAASAHDTFWDFVSLMPESMHMLMWAMSDRAIPRSLRMIEGFGVHTFRCVNADGRVDLREVPLAADARRAVRRLGRGGEDQRRRSRLSSARPVRGDRDAAISRSGSFGSRLRPEDRRRASTSTSSTPTKLIPEELVPLTPIGRMVLDRNPTTSSPRPSRSPSTRAHRAGHRLHRRSAAAGPAVLVHGHATDPPRRAELPRDPDQPADLPDAQLPARRPYATHEVNRGRVNYEPNSLEPNSS